MSRRRRERRQATAPKKASPSRKPAKASKKAANGWLGKGVLVAFALLLLAFLGGYLWAQSYLRSDEFRQQLAQQIGSAVKGKATVGEIEWQGAAMEVEELGLLSRQAGDWEIADVSAKIDLGGIWNRTWLIPEIRMREATSRWDFRQEIAKPDEPVAKPTVAKTTSAGKGSSLLPNRTEVHQVRVEDYAGEVLTDGGSYRWKGMTLECEPRQQLSTLVTLTGGRLLTPHKGFEELELKSADLAIRKDGIEMTRSDWSVDGMGELGLTAGVDDEGRKLKAEFEDWQFIQMLPPELAPFFAGTLNGEILWMQNLDSESDKVFGGVELKDGVIQGVPFMNRLAAYAGSARLRKLTLEEARATVHKSGDRWEVKDLVLFDKGLLRVEGQLTIEGEALSGRLHLGVPPGLLAHIPGAEEKVFLRENQGLLWTPVEISGTLKHPKEDLSERMIRAAGERMFEMIPETGVWALRYGTQAMDESTALLLENQGLILEEGTRAVEEVIEQGSGVVEEGVRTGFGILNGILGGEEE
ncbi:hypothetical protein AAFN60_20025 [Roseibacillus persicicus]|uniref:hypothetical protein n=1 Tax=Roseibacillus persicicus TaxID=454148 RepID=UPI00398AD8F9